MNYEDLSYSAMNKLILGWNERDKSILKYLVEISENKKQNQLRKNEV